jgi:hypothetical protein
MRNEECGFEKLIDDGVALILLPIRNPKSEIEWFTAGLRKKRKRAC